MSAVIGWVLALALTGCGTFCSSVAGDMRVSPETRAGLTVLAGIFHALALWTASLLT